ncbi:MAG: glycosyltransferase [Methanolinea sp.]|jgi:glycosyltransferase involved in cell wall biosynthesis|nr:glycosyltransferase [Methanolinea sp.]
MKRILIISYHFNKKEAIGAIRLQGLTRHLRSFGWESTIICGDTRECSDFFVNEILTNDILTNWKKTLGLNVHLTLKEQLEVQSQKNKKTFLDFILNLWAEIFTYPDVNKTWINPAIKKGQEILRNEKYDVIISSSGPASVNLVASRLASEFNIPWIADFRDLWTQNHYYSHSKIRKFFECHLEIKTLSNANVLITVSQPLAEKLQELHKNKKVIAIPNGFDPEQMNPGIPVTGKFSITYTGNLYQGRRDPELLFRIARDLINENLIDPNILEITFYGYDEGWLIQDVKKYGLDNCVKIYGMIPREESIQKQREAQILLLLTWNDPEEKGVYTGKLFDYLAARRPILSLGYTGGGVVKELLDQTHAGVHCSNEAELREYLLRAYREYRELGAVQYHGIGEEIMKYSHVEMARKFAEVLDAVTAGATPMQG